MKFLATLAAGLIAASAMTPIPAANAQRVVVVDRHHVDGRQDRRHGYNDRRSGRSRYRTVCRTRYDHGRRIRRCRQVRR